MTRRNRNVNSPAKPQQTENSPNPPASGWEWVKRIGSIASAGLSAWGVLVILSNGIGRLETVETTVVGIDSTLKNEVTLRKRHFEEQYVKSVNPARADSAVYEEDPDRIYWVEKRKRN